MARTPPPTLRHLDPQEGSLIMPESKRTSRGIKGVPIEIGGETLVIPPLNFRQLEEFAETLVGFTKWGTSPNPYKEMPKALPVILAAIQRNYPDYSQDDVEINIDMGNYRAVFEAIMGVSGITKSLLAAGEPQPIADKPRVM